MNRMTPVAVFLLIAGTLVLSPCPGSAMGPGAAFFVKIIPEVTHKTADTDWAPAEKTAIIAVGDRIRTAEKALAILKFQDRSIVKVRENSELVITGTIDAAKVIKEVDVRKGVIGFIIGKQERNEQFRFTSPTSVAAIRGTQGAFAVSLSADTLIVTEGVVRFHNSVSGDSVDVAAGFTGISGSTGSLEVRASTPGETAAAQEAIESGETDNEFELQLKDGQGNRRKLKIEFKE